MKIKIKTLGLIFSIALLFSAIFAAVQAAELPHVPKDEFPSKDVIVPIITALNPENNEELVDADVVLQVKLNENVTNVAYSLNGEENITMVEKSSLIFESASLDLLDGESYLITYYATDLMGNIGNLTIEFTINEPDNKYKKTFFKAEYPEDYDFSKSAPAIDLTTEKGLNTWQKFINNLCRFFSLEEIY